MHANRIQFIICFVLILGNVVCIAGVGAYWWRTTRLEYLVNKFISACDNEDWEVAEDVCEEMAYYHSHSEATRMAHWKMEYIRRSLAGENVLTCLVQPSSEFTSADSLDNFRFPEEGWDFLREMSDDGREDECAVKK